MKGSVQILALIAALFVPTLRADQAASANYSIATSIDGGGQGVVSDAYAQNVIITPLAGRSVATFSVSMVLGFGSQLNTPPVAVDDVRSHPQDAAVSITGTSLFGNDFDPDGDALSLAGVDQTSAGGATLTVSGQTITYSPPAGLSGADHFQYTVADSNGDVSSATVTMVVASPVENQPINTVSVTEQQDGQLLIRFRQQTGWAEYVIQFTHDLNNADWQILQDVHAGADGIVEVLVDPSAAKQTFFRAVVF